LAPPARSPWATATGATISNWNRQEGSLWTDLI